MIYLSGYFINPSKFRPGPCTCTFTATVNDSFRRSVIFYLALARVDRLAVGWRCGFSSPIYLDVSSTIGICLFVVFLVSKVVLSTTLAFREIFEASDSFLLVPLRLLFVRNFLKSFKVVGGQSGLSVFFSLYALVTVLLV